MVHECKNNKDIQIQKRLRFKNDFTRIANGKINLMS